MDTEARIKALEQRVEDIVDYLGAMMMPDGSNYRRFMWVNDAAATGKVFGRFGLVAENDEEIKKTFKAAGLALGPQEGE